MTITRLLGSSQIQTESFATAERGRRLQMLIVALIVSAVLGVAYVAFGLDSPLLPALLMAAVALPVMLWHMPRAVLYIGFVAACLFELFPTGFPDAITDRVPFFWNINSILQTYAHVNAKGVPLNLLEVFLLLAGLLSLIRAVFTRSASLRGGQLLIPVMIYMGFVVWAWINGILSGGDFKLSLQEIRAQFYFGAAYLMAVNLVRTTRQVTLLWWLTAASIAFKGALYTFRRYVTLGGQPLPDQGVGSHEEAFFFVCYLLLLAALYFVGDPAHRKLRWFMTLMVPLVVLGDLATNRRAGTAAFVIAIPIMLLMAYRCWPRCRRVIVAASVAFAILGPAYYMAFKNSNAAFAQPARAVKSNFEPDDRDASSNAYREAENADQMATIRESPLLGYGYGRRMLHAVPIADISQTYEWWDLLPHNQVLWVWMRVGTFGYVAFWAMVCSGLIAACETARDENRDVALRTTGLFFASAFVALIIFGMLDLQLSNFRTMLFAGFWMGVVGSSGSISQIAAAVPAGLTRRIAIASGRITSV